MEPRLGGLNARMAKMTSRDNLIYTNTKNQEYIEVVESKPKCVSEVKRA